MDRERNDPRAPELRLVRVATQQRSAARSAFDRLPVTVEQVADLLRRAEAA